MYWFRKCHSVKNMYSLNIGRFYIHVFTKRQPIWLRVVKHSWSRYTYYSVGLGYIAFILSE